MINKTRLKQLIKEELSRFLAEEEDIPTAKSSDMEPTAKTNEPKTPTGTNYFLPVAKALTKTNVKIPVSFRKDFYAGNSVTVSSTCVRQTNQSVFNDDEFDENFELYLLNISPSVEKVESPFFQGAKETVFKGKSFLLQFSLADKKAYIHSGNQITQKPIAVTAINANEIWNVVTAWINKNM